MRTDHDFLQEALLASHTSMDPNTRVGVVVALPEHDLILSRGANRFPDYVIPRTERPEKYLYIEHAERVAIYQAIRSDHVVRGATLYLTYEPRPCADCARAIVMSGIKRVVGTDILFPGSHWEASLEAGRKILHEAGVATVAIRVSEDYRKALLE